MTYFYPNRPVLIPADSQQPLNPRPDYLNSLEASGRWVAEKKWNGDNALLYTTDWKIWNRHNNPLHYTPSPEVLEELHRFPKDSIINFECVHSKTKTVKHLLVVHCVMAWKGKVLTGKTWGDSRKILEDFGRFGRHVVLSLVWTSGFWDLFQEADGQVIEGIVLKDPKGLLKFSSTPLADVGWMRKVRKPCKKYNI